MDRLRNSEAKEVFRYFEEICKIPHGSGNVRMISDYLAEFARSRGLEYQQDEIGNVVIIKEASAGYEQEAPLILQGHMDMVAVKKPDCEKDMSREGLDVKRDGDWLYAEGTSLGGDDGIAVACMLALLDSDEIAHPRLEMVITVDEETGMDGARAIDLGICRGSRMLNLDSEEEGIFLTSCAGGGRLHGLLCAETEAVAGTKYRLRIGGLLGGHSGGEIHKERGNSNRLAGRFGWEALSGSGLRLISLEGGLADNAIPRETLVEALVPAGGEAAFEAALDRFAANAKKELQVKDPGFFAVVEEKAAGSFAALTAEDTKRALFLLVALPGGVQAMSADIPGLVQTSLNLGILSLKDGRMQLDYSVRSSVQSEKQFLLDQMTAILASQGASWEITGEYPAWEYRADSALREKMVAVYEEMYGKQPRIEAIHAGLECGILGGKIADLDCVSIGPDMQDIHTTEERLSIPSVERVWRYILAVLAKKG